jgi:hypothetical protein
MVFSTEYYEGYDEIESSTPMEIWTGDPELESEVNSKAPLGRQNYYWEKVKTASGEIQVSRGDNFFADDIAKRTSLYYAPSYFYVEYFDPVLAKKIGGTSLAYNRRWIFSLLPAVETSSGTRQVPEVKPGILKKVGVNIKSFNIAGAPPVFQVLGLQPTILQIVGLFIGDETFETRNDSDSYEKDYGTTSANPNAIYSTAPGVDLKSQDTALTFEREVVQLGRQVTIRIRSAGGNQDSSLFLNYEALIQNFRVHIVRSDRTYFAFDAIVLNYKHHSRV